MAQSPMVAQGAQSAKRRQAVEGAADYLRSWYRSTLGTEDPSLGREGSLGEAPETRLGAADTALPADTGFPTATFADAFGTTSALAAALGKALELDAGSSASCAPSAGLSCDGAVFSGSAVLPGSADGVVSADSAGRTSAAPEATAPVSGLGSLFGKNASATAAPPASTTAAAPMASQRVLLRFVD